MYILLDASKVRIDRLSLGPQHMPAMMDNSTMENKTKENINRGHMKIKNQVLASFAAGLLTLSCGLAVSLPSSLIPILLQEGDLVQSFHEASWLATIFLFVCIPSSILGGLCSDKIGRRKTGLLSCLPVFAGWVVLSTSTAFSSLLIGRSLLGFGVMLGFPSANVLVSEVVHPSTRGYLGVVPAILLSVGMFIVYLLGYILTSWRLICWILVSQPILTVLALLFIKESPYWLIQQGNKEEALRSLQWYRGEGYDVTDEFDEIINKKQESEKTEGWKEKVDLVLSVPFARALIITGLPFFLLQFTGIPALVMFMASIFQDTGLSLDPTLAPVIVGAVRCVFSVFSSIALKSGNRKYIFCGSLFLLGICMIGMSILNKFSSEYDNWFIGILPLVIILVVFMAHAFGINSIIHLLCAEVYPTPVRSFGCGLSLCLGGAGNAIQSFLYPYILSWVGTSGCFLYFSVFAFFLSVYSFFVIPDNRDKSLVSIERTISETKPKKKKMPV